MTLNSALLRHFANNYEDFLSFYRSGVISYAVACSWCNQIGGYVQAVYYSDRKAA